MSCISSVSAAVWIHSAIFFAIDNAFVANINLFKILRYSLCKRHSVHVPCHMIFEWGQKQLHIWNRRPHFAYSLYTLRVCDND